MQKFDLKSISGRRPYIRTLNFILQKAVKELYPEKDNVLRLDFDLPSGLYGEVSGVTMTEEKVFEIRAKMREIISKNIPIEEEELSVNDAIKVFEDNGQYEKAILTGTTGRTAVTVNKMGDYLDTFYGPMLSSTGAVKVFGLIPYLKGFCIVYPSYEDPMTIQPTVKQDKLSGVFYEHSNWCKVLKAHGIGSLNEGLEKGYSKVLIQVSEALHEHKLAEIANMIYDRRDKVRLVLIAGPSSSGKTTTSKRIALHTKVNGMNPIVMALDNYFVNREHTPRDEKGDYDYESIHALDLDFLNKQLNDLFNGEEIEMPRYDFVTGERTFDGKTLKLNKDDILVMEGIHALNPELTAKISDDKKFRIYASALTSLSIDENNNISTSDNRLLRRMVRDNQFRGINPESTILRWTSVRKGEVKNIFPYQENADVMFNSALIYEFPLLKCYAEPLLRGDRKSTRLNSSH